MDIQNYLIGENEKPLDRSVENGGFTSIFRTIGCVGDSLSSGEFEAYDAESGHRAFPDMMEYSWGQFVARAAGCKVYNFSRGGMTAKEYMESFADQRDFWNADKLCQAYIIALGINDLFGLHQAVGDVSDIDPEHPENNKDTFCGWYARIIQRLKQLQPHAKFFLMTIPRENIEEKDVIFEKHANLMHQLAEYFPYTYVLDLFRYAPVYDEAFKKRFYLGDGHMNPMGYRLTADMVMRYIDYHVRSDYAAFAQVGFIGTEYHNSLAKW